MCPIVISIPCRGRYQYLPALLDKIAATKTSRTKVVVVSNGPDRFPSPGLPDVHVAHIGDIPTIPVSVNFGWYALGSPGSILVKLDNDVDPPDNWEAEIVSHADAIDLGGFLSLNETNPTSPIVVRGRKARAPHMSESWHIPFVWSAFLWLAPRIADRLFFEDERFVRSDDGEIAERALRIPDTTIAHCHDTGIVHQSPLFTMSTEHHELLMEMYDACDLLIRALPERPICQDTIWRDCLSREDAERLVMSDGILSEDVTEKAKTLLRTKLEEAFALVGRRDLVERIFSEV
jgi:hypothetical protein